MSSALDRMRAIASLRGLSSTQKAVLWALELRADNDSGECWPSLATLAEDAGVSRTCVKRIVPGLVALGHISKRSRRRAGVLEADSNIYTIHVGREPSEVGHVGPHVGPVGPYPLGFVGPQVGHVGPHRGSRRTLRVGSHVPGGGVLGVQELLTELPIGTAHGTGEGAEPLSLTLEPTRPAPSDAKPTAKRTKAKAATKGTRLPADWHPSAATLRRFRECEHIDAGGSLERFRNYWLAKTGASATKADWERTFVNWVLEDVARGRAASLPAPAWEPPPLVGSPDDAARAIDVIGKLVAAKSAKNLTTKGAANGS